MVFPTICQIRRFVLVRDHKDTTIEFEASFAKKIYQEIRSVQYGDIGTFRVINYEPDASMVSIGWCNGMRTSNDHDALRLDKKVFGGFWL